MDVSWGRRGGLKGIEIAHLRTVNKVSCSRVPGNPMHGRTFQPMEAPLQPHLPCESHLHSVPSLMGVSAEKRPFFPTVGKSQKIPSAFVALLKMKSAKGGYPLQASTHRHTCVFSFSTAASDPKVNGKGV